MSKTQFDILLGTIITREEAEKAGLKKYFTGKPCKHGHISVRRVDGGCIECTNIRANLSSKRSIEKLEKYNKNRHKKYMSKKYKEAGYMASGCEICNTKSKGFPQFDHCHKKGHFRGWLCVPCNVLVGRIENNPLLLQKVMNYIDYTKNDNPFTKLFAEIEKYASFNRD
jgi:hypothetical protein